MKKFLFSLLFLISAVFFISKASGNALQDSVAKGNEAYQAGRYSEAARFYESVLKAGFESQYLYYNLGNAYFKTKDFPSAILNYERAKRLDPANEDIDFNLNVTNTLIVDKTESLPEIFLVRWWNGIVDLFSADGWGILVIICVSLAFLFLLFYFISRSVALRKILFYTSVVFFIFSLIGFLMARHQFGNKICDTQAVIFAPTITAKSSPDETGTDLFIIHEGIKVTIIDKLGDWTEIRLANGSEGWIKTVDFKVI